MIIKYVDYNEEISEKSCKTCSNNEKCHYCLVNDLSDYFDIENCKQYRPKKMVQTITFHDEELEKQILDLIKTSNVKFARIND